MIIDPRSVPAKDCYKIMIGAIVPRPIAFVSTVSTDGVCNLAPFSFFTGITSSPPTICFAPGRSATGGRKDKRDTAWGRQVLDDGRPFIGRTADDIRAHFDDHAVILGLGLESVLNVPVRLRGRTIGTMNLLHAANHYDRADLDVAFPLAGQLVGPLIEAFG